MAGRPGTLVGALVVAGLLAGAATAQAAPRQCTDAIGPETVRGDVVVPAGAACHLVAGTRVRGSVQVRDGASLFAEQADVDGSVRGTTGSRLDFDGGSVNGSVESNSGAALNLISIAVDGPVRVQGGGTEVFGDGVDARGSLEATGAEFFDLHNSTVSGNFVARDTRLGSFFCGNTLNGNAEFVRNLALLVIGSPTGECAGNRVSGNMRVEDNEAETEISGNEVRGNLICFDNDPPPLGGGNQVRGNKEGQCRLL